MRPLHGMDLHLTESEVWALISLLSQQSDLSPILHPVLAQMENAVVAESSEQVSTFLSTSLTRDKLKISDPLLPRSLTSGVSQST